MGQVIETHEVGTGFEETQKSMDVLDKEPLIRWNVKQSAKGGLYYEFTVRGDTIEDIKELALKCKKELEEICRV